MELCRMVMREGIRFIEVSSVSEGVDIITQIQNCDDTYNLSVETTQGIDDPSVLRYWVVIWEQYDDCVSEDQWDNSVPYKEGILI